MRTKQKSLHGFSILMFFLFFITITILSSCSNEQVLSEKEHRVNGNSKVTFEQFKQETGLKNFKTVYKTDHSVSTTSRNADGSYELSDFNISTDVIKKLVINEKITYTFIVIPKIIKDNTIFNLTMFYKDGDWQASFVELKPTATNWDELKDGTKQTFDGQMKLANVENGFLFNVLYNGNCTTIVTGDLHCTHEAPWCTDETGCDLCAICASIKFFTFCDALPNFIIGTDDTPMSGGGGGGPVDHTPIFTDPSGYIFDPLMPAMGQQYTDIQHATALWNSLTTGEGSEQEWACNHPDDYNDLVHYYLGNFTSQLTVPMQQIINQMMENPDLFTSVRPLLIEKNIDDTNLNPCQKGIVTQLKSLEQTDIATIIAKFGNPNSIYNTKLISDDNMPSDEYGNTDWAGTTPLPYDYKIKLNSNYMQYATKLSIASTILHEMIHAYFLSLVDDNLETGDAMLSSFPNLWNFYVLNATGSASLEQHITMANNYVDILARALQEYQTGVAVSADSQPDQVYKDLAWGGLYETPAFTSKTTEEQSRIHAVNDAETDNLPAYDLNGNIYNPIGSPCN